MCQVLAAETSEGILHPRFEIRQILAAPDSIRQAFHREALLLEESPSHVEVQVHINAVTVQLIQEIVQTIDLFRIKGSLAIHNRSPDSARSVGCVVMVNSQAIDSPSCQMGGHFFGIGMRREVAAKARINAPKSNSSTVGREVTVVDPENPSAPAG